MSWVVKSRGMTLMEPIMDLTSTPPKLAFSALPAKRPEPAGWATPPLRLPGSVPFRWEEAPGKPRTEPGPPASAAAAFQAGHYCLDLPPRLVAAAAAEEAFASSAAAVALGGPHTLGRAMSLSSASCYSFSFAESRSATRIAGRKERAARWFWKRGGSKKEGSWEVMSLEDMSRSSSSESSMSSTTSYSYNSDEEDGKGKTTVAITRFRRSRRTVANFSNRGTSDFWASIYGSLKQAVLWRRRSRS